MTEKEFTNILAAITSLYPSFSVEDELKYTLWKRQLSGMEFRIVLDNLERYAAENRFPPTVSDLRGGAALKLLPYQQKNEGALAQLDEWQKAAEPKSPDEIRRMREELFGK